MIINDNHSIMLSSPARTIKGRVEFYNSSTLTRSFTGADSISSISVNRAGDKKFFGFGICQEAEVKLLDKDRAIHINQDETFKIYFGVNDDYISPAPTFSIIDIARDENTNGIIVKGGDAIYKSSKHTFSELTLPKTYTLSELAHHIGAFLGLHFTLVDVDAKLFNFTIDNNANLEGTETIRSVLDAIAEVTQTIYYIDGIDLVFKQLNRDSDAVITIRRDDYFTLKSHTDITLSKITKTTELGDALSASTGESGVEQFIRNNPFLELRTDVADLLDNAIDIMGGLTINQFECSWRGNYLLQPADKINLITKDGDLVTSYILTDSYSYTGGLNATSSWEYYETQKDETANNPTNLGDKVNQTFAKVDKVNKRIELVAGEVADTNSKVSNLELTTESINASVKDVKQELENADNALDTRIDILSQEVGVKITKEEVEISIETRLQEGVDKVITAGKKYTFDDEGLNISSSGNNINTTITEDGMKIYRAGQEVLKADNEGVKAEDLHATTYLIIGDTSRLETRLSRTACFWIGE